MKPYLICSTGRSGSNYLKNLLKSQGLGHACEWDPDARAGDTKEQLLLNNVDLPHRSPVWSRTIWNCRLKRFIEHVRLQGSFVHCDSDTEVLEGMFPDLQYIYLYRADKLAQAISMVKAQQSNEWIVWENLKQKHGYSEFIDYKYDYDQILHELKDAYKEEKNWNKWFSDNNVYPCTVMYEQTFLYPDHVLRMIFEHFDISSSVDKNAIESHFKLKTSPLIQRNDINQEWAHKFIAESDSEVRELATKGYSVPRRNRE